jgi:hypothetical protein
MKKIIIVIFPISQSIRPAIHSRGDSDLNRVRDEDDYYEHSW